ncbi:MAG: hypothetical protein AAFO07_21285 [Bacteroidota bacterium]
MLNFSSSLKSTFGVFSLLLMAGLLVPSYGQGELFSNTDAVRGWSWDDTIASYCFVQDKPNTGKETILVVRPYDGSDLGAAFEKKHTSSDNMRGWNWDGATASYVAYNKFGGKCILYIRPFDGREFGPVSSQQDMTASDNIRGWSWDGTTASYMAFNDKIGKTELYVRPFDGRSFGPVSYKESFSSADNIRGWSWYGGKVSYIGKTGNTFKIFKRSFDGKQFGPVEN